MLSQTNLWLWKNKVLSGIAYNPDIAYRTNNCVALGSMIFKCNWCKVLKWKDKTTGMCCYAEQVHPEGFKQLPERYNLVKGGSTLQIAIHNSRSIYNYCK